MTFSSTIRYRLCMNVRVYTRTQLSEHLYMSMFYVSVKNNSDGEMRATVFHKADVILYIDTGLCPSLPFLPHDTSLS